MRARVTSKTSLFYGEEGEVIRWSSNGRTGEVHLVIHLDKTSGSGDPFALPFSEDEIWIIDEDEADDDAVDAHYSGLERLEEGL